MPNASNFVSFDDLQAVHYRHLNYPATICSINVQQQEVAYTTNTTAVTCKNCIWWIENDFEETI